MKILPTMLLVFFAGCMFPKSKQHKQNEQNIKQISIQNKKEGSFFLYKKPLHDIQEEYKEGVYYIYDTEQNISHILPDTILMDRSEGWIISNNRVVILNMSDITIFNEYQKKVDQLFFNNGEMALGGIYDDTEGIIYFLLKTKRNQVDLCKLTIETNELKRIKHNIEISGDEFEAPFKKIRFSENRSLHIEKDCNSFYTVKLLGNYDVRKINFDNGICTYNSLGFNKDGIVYVKHKNADKISYEVKFCNPSNAAIKTLLDGHNKDKRDVIVYLICNEHIKSFLINIDGKFYLYNYNSFREIKFNKKSEVVFFSNRKIFCLTAEGEIKSIDIDVD